MKPLKFLSLFAGVGGFDCGLEQAGMVCIGQCEIEPFPLLVLKKHWPHVARFGNVKNLTYRDSVLYDRKEGRKGTHYKGQIDVVCGGFP